MTKLSSKAKDKKNINESKQTKTMNISVYGLWRDSSKYMDNTLLSLDRLSKIPNTKFSFYFYENDSIDDTRQKLLEWCGTNENKTFIYDDLGSPKFNSTPDVERLILLSFYRNKFNSFFSKDTSDYSLLLDTDIIFDNSHFELLLNSIKSLNAAAVVANTRNNVPDLMLGQTRDSFYDVFCLRDKFFNKGLYFTDCPLVLLEDRKAWENNEPVEILSGFSGFFLAKTELLAKCKWSTCSDSEHINFCLQLHKYGGIYLIPNCKPRTFIDTSSLNKESCINIAEEQIGRINYINQIFYSSLQTKWQ